MSGEGIESKKNELALAIARGGSVAKWAHANGVSKATAYAWSNESAVRKAVEAFRRRIIDEAIGLMTKHTAWAADGIIEVAKNAESDAVRLRAYRAIFSDMLAASKYTGMERRMCDLEKRVGEAPGAQAGNAESPAQREAGADIAPPAVPPALPAEPGNG
jgi:hypothetical protein